MYITYALTFSYTCSSGPQTNNRLLFSNFFINFQSVPANLYSRLNNQRTRIDPIFFAGSKKSWYPHITFLSNLHLYYLLSMQKDFISWHKVSISIKNEFVSLIIRNKPAMISVNNFKHKYNWQKLKRNLVLTNCHFLYV